MPRFTFEKFPGAEPLLTTSMKSVGEAMAIGRSFAESVQKALRSMETGLTGFDEVAIEGVESAGKDAVKAALAKPTPDRLLLIAQAYRHGLSTAEIHAACQFDPWFLERIARDRRRRGAGARATGCRRTATGLLRLKQMGFSDARLGRARRARRGGGRGTPPRARPAPGLQAHRHLRRRVRLADPVYVFGLRGRRVRPARMRGRAERARDKVVILGGGPNRIGQGIEFDYCCVHAAYSLSEAGIETIMVNCNPETVSTDYDTSDRLYFEPLTAEDVIEIVRVERAKRHACSGVIVQFGGQTPLKLAAALGARATSRSSAPRPTRSTWPRTGERFQELLTRLGLRQPENGTAHSADEAEAVAPRIGYPVVIRPSYVLGGRAMEIVHDAAGLDRYMRACGQRLGHQARC